MPAREKGHVAPARGQHVPFSGLVQAHTPGESRPFAPIAMEGTGENRLLGGGKEIRTLGPSRKGKTEKVERGRLGTDNHRSIRGYLAWPQSGYVAHPFPHSAVPSFA